MSEAVLRRKMATFKFLFQVFAYLLFYLCQPVAASFDGGDAAALVIGLVLGILGICACIGAYARKRAGSGL